MGDAEGDAVIDCVGGGNRVGRVLTLTDGDGGAALISSSINIVDRSLRMLSSEFRTDSIILSVTLNGGMNTVATLVSMPQKLV